MVMYKVCGVASDNNSDRGLLIIELLLEEVMFDNSVVQILESSQEESFCRRTVVDDAFIRSLIDSFVGDDVAGGIKTIQSEFRHSVVFIFSAEHDHNCFSYMLDYALREEGIDRELEFEIFSKKARLVVNCDHPEKDRLERVLNKNNDLYEAFKRMCCSYARIASIYLSQTYSKENHGSRRGTIGRCWEIFGRRHKGLFSVSVSTRGCEPKFVV